MATRIQNYLQEKNGGNQSEMARFVGVSPQAVQKWIAGQAEPRGKNLELAAQFLGVTPSLLKFGTEVGAPTVVARHPDDPIPDDVVMVPEHRVEFSAGNGRVHYEIMDDNEPATYRRSWFQKYGINPDRVRRFRVSGDSMEPLLFARDTILVNLDETQVIDGRLYALRYGDQLRVKYLSRRLDGTLILRSVNPAYKDEEVPAEAANEHITVIGRVRDRSGTGGL
ncbi:helix-turn-helix transcriptional regulator [Massilia sp. UMI-21]|nr:helix-turn-helix transcriptional regulator [Massilia sp. UMI-21]